MHSASSLPQTPICRQSKRALRAPARASAGPRGLAPALLPRTSMSTECLLQSSLPFLYSCGPPSIHLGLRSMRNLVKTNFFRKLGILARLLCDPLPRDPLPLLLMTDSRMPDQRAFDFKFSDV